MLPTQTKVNKSCLRKLNQRINYVLYSIFTYPELLQVFHKCQVVSTTVVVAQLFLEWMTQLWKIIGEQGHWSLYIKMNLDSCWWTRDVIYLKSRVIRDKIKVVKNLKCRCSINNFIWFNYKNTTSSYPSGSLE